MKQIPTQMIPIGLVETNKGQVPGLPRNPRLIKDDHFRKLKQSIQDNPEMLYLRELLVFKHDGKYVTIGGNTNPDDVATLMDGEKADMVFTDPPYGVSYVGTNNPNGKEWKMIENDNLRGDKLYQFLLAAFRNIAEHMKLGGAFYIWFASVNHIQFETAIQEAKLKVKQELIWDKGMVLGHSDYHWAYEPCLYGCHRDINCQWYGDRSQKTFLAMNRTDIRKMTKETMQDILLHLHEGRSVWQVKRDSVCDYVHPTQKPIGLAGIGIRNSSARGHTVLDLFGGSGSTLMAAEQLQRKARVMEYDPHYVDVIIARWERYTGLKAELIANSKCEQP